jgi:hypothetical protein
VGRPVIATGRHLLQSATRARRFPFKLGKEEFGEFHGGL